MKSPTRLLAVPFIAALSFGSLLRGASDTKTESKPVDYPISTCVVSDEKLGEMGEPVKYVYHQAGKPDRTVLLCCKDCLKEIEKDPAKYVAKLDEAAAKAKTPAPADHEHKEHKH